MYACKATVYILQNKCLFCKDIVFHMNGKTYSEFITILPNVGERMIAGCMKIRGHG